ncbi:DNA mismatch repair endonuclease MutL [Buchnera aphidicola (Sitobion avenae)]|uniref:DNA mismatch repair protein MutL n=1 Tax=Buchnera aphidicola (Sitobion avenae) TaxID=571428 RepID=A0A4D6Y7Y2_9GAMM|nr:DNA mismatch repair endonuclease MutL [Buchnera aphidicola]QCI25747.1 DNA mismatch repair endonuclease MutL [Buchnera aphidicola (Sitobion avenae)]
MSIRVLPKDLSSQISAGEIIERPASVVKEIIENSIDAGSKNINIFIEKSGFQSIILKDDGCGINKKDLLLAVCHHATSKITSLSDLDVLTTFGFRGEALASIRAVSRLTLISCTQFNDCAWKIYLEGFSNNYIPLQPIAHPQGTTIIIENLFYNMPVRLKFLKNKKLEFLKICEVVRKIALSYFYVNFSLEHNKKLIIKYNSVNNKNNKIHRLQDIFNISDANQFLEVKEKNKYNMILFGWISHPYACKELKNIQYCYVNNRCIYNNIFLKAVRSAYHETIGKTNISFILYLEISPDNIDFNIHPTKNEIKFHKPNVIYKFIYETVFYNLKKIEKKYLSKDSLSNPRINLHDEKKIHSNPLDSIFLTLISLFFFKKKYFKNINIKKICNDLAFDIFLEKYQCSIGKLLTITREYYGLIHHRKNFLLISFPLAKGMVRRQKLKDNIEKKIIYEYFSSNIKINTTPQEYGILFHIKETLLKFGFRLIFKKNYVILCSIPIFLKKCNTNVVVSDFFKFLFLKKPVLISQIVDWFYINVFIELKDWTRTNGIKVLLEMEYYCPLLLKNPPPKLLQKININKALCILKI